MLYMLQTYRVALITFPVVIEQILMFIRFLKKTPARHYEGIMKLVDCFCSRLTLGYTVVVYGDKK